MARIKLLLISLSFCILVDLHSVDASHEKEYLGQKELTIIVDNVPSVKENTFHKTCNQYNCFNHLQCEINESQELLYYVYPPLTFMDRAGNLLYSSKSMFSREYWQVISTILESSRITLDPSRACFFIPSIDLALLHGNESSKLSVLYENLPYWRFVDGRPGTNHMIIALDPDQNITAISGAIGNSILISNKHNTWTFRQDFDYNIGLIGPDTSSKGWVNHGEQQKLVLTQYTSLSGRQRASVDKLKQVMGKEFQVLGYKCSNSSVDCNEEHDEGAQLKCLDKTASRCSEENRQLELEYPKLLESFQYCLVLKPESDTVPLGDTGHYLLAQALMHKCVPIISVDLILPYHSWPDWSFIAIQLTNDHNLERVEKTIVSIGSRAQEMMSRSARVFWAAHFRTPQQLVRDVMLHYDRFVYPIHHSFQPYCQP